MNAMRTAAKLTIAIAGIVLLSAGVQARTRIAVPSRAPTSAMHVFGVAPAPYGHVLFCERLPYECTSELGESTRVDASPERLKELHAVNKRVNLTIAPVTDLALHGQREYWTMPVNKGDCEDYVIMKRRRLIERGWPAGSLLMTVVEQKNGEGHAVLTVRTKQGDFVLDNLDTKVQLWHRTPYRYLMRQSFLDPRKWMLLQPSVTPAPRVSAAHRSDEWSTRVLPSGIGR
jgi:predicted transglutaminase-like cysteine proteinase